MLQKEQQIEFERNEMAEIIANNAPSDSHYDASDFEWAAHYLQVAGYRKQGEAEWILEYEYYGKMICSNCKTEAPITTKLDNGYRMYTEYVKKPFCPNCGAQMKGGVNHADA